MREDASLPVMYVTLNQSEKSEVHNREYNFFIFYFFINQLVQKDVHHFIDISFIVRKMQKKNAVFGDFFHLLTLNTP